MNDSQHQLKLESYMKMKTLFIIILFIVWIILIKNCLSYQDSKFHEIQNNLNNNLKISGEIIDIKVSNNHCFGIMYLHVDSLYVGNFRDTILKEGIYPYKIKNNNAELYMSIPGESKIGEKVIIDSNKKTVFHTLLNGSMREYDDLSIITNPINIRYVAENSKLR